MNGNDGPGQQAVRPVVAATRRVAGRLRGLLVIRPRVALRLTIERLWHSFIHAIGRDLDAGHGAPWAVLAFALGIWGYFALPREPFVWATIPLALALAATAWWRRSRGRPGRGAVLLACACAGLACADLRAARVEAPRLERERTHEVTGRIVAVERRQGTAGSSGYRLLVAPRTMSKVPPDRLPRLVRVTVRSGESVPRVSKPVRFLARLSPPGGAVLPGGYAFDQAAYFASIGASGFVYGDLKPVVDAGDWPEPGWRLHLGGALTDIRFAISARIRDSLSDPATGTDSEAGGIAAALIVGDRGGVSEAAQESLRVAGLAHVLAISGMHMALVAGTIFFAVRAVLAASPALALGYPIRHWAAGAALVAATVYLALSGASIATQRAYIMAAIVFIAMLSGRRALTMRSVAVAALLILAASPEALLQPGFQMSFAAVIALVAAYEAWRKRGARETTRAGHTLWHGLRFWIAGLLVTSLIAGLATAPIAAVHFYRTAPLGLLANMAAMPLVSLVIMPAAVASVLAMPFGLDPLPLSAMGAGIDAMLAIAETVARWTPSGGLVGAVPPVVGLACVAGLLLLALLKSRWRLIGLAPISLAAVLHFGFPPVRPDILISEDGRTVAARQPDGRLAILQGSGGRFAAEVWLRADGDVAPLADRKARAPVARCDDLGCVLSAGLQAHAAPARAARAPPALHIAVPKTPQALPEDCRQADVIVAFFEVPDWCARSALVFDRTRLLRDGAAALYLAGPSDTRMPGGARDPVSKQPGPGTGAAMPLDADVPPLVRSARIETVRNGRHRPWHGAPAD